MARLNGGYFGARNVTKSAERRGKSSGPGRRERWGERYSPSSLFGLTSMSDTAAALATSLGSPVLRVSDETVQLRPLGLDLPAEAFRCVFQDPEARNERL